MTCDWPVDTTCLPDLPDPGEGGVEDPSDEYTAAVAEREAAVALAIDVMFTLSGRQFGVCEVIARPCPGPRRVVGDGSFPFTFPVYLGNGSLWMSTTCGCATWCTYNAPGVVHLPGPVREVTAVTLADTELDTDQWVLEGDMLYRVGDSTVWPSQNLGRPLGSPGTWSVQYMRGIAPPTGTGKFVGTLAAEFLAVCSGSKCRLPRNVTAVTRQGVSYQVYDPNAIYANGKTGLAEVDLWLSSVNPHHVMQAPTVR